MAEDHTALRQSFISSLNDIPNFLVVGEAKNGHELLNVIKNTSPDIAIIDVEMPLMNGYEALKIISSEYPKVKSIIFSMHGGEHYIAEMLTAGACAYLIKNCEIFEVINTINKVYTEGFCFNKNISKRVVSNATKNDKLEIILKQIALTDREIEVLKLVCEGKGNKEIAMQLNISTDTVDYHRRNIKRKTCTDNLASLLKYSIKNGITDID